MDYDKDAAFFGVYDGHGGHEVAEYLSRHLPQFLKDMDLYKAGEIEKALIEGFLKMDESLNTPEVMAILKDIAMDGADVEENIDTLYEEASMPVEKLIEKYRDGVAQSVGKTEESGSKSIDVNNGAGCSKVQSRSERNRKNVGSSCTSQTEKEDNAEESADKSEDSNDKSTVLTDEEKKSTGDSVEKSKETPDSSKEEGELDKSGGKLDLFIAIL